MDNQKIENQLNLALDATELEREKSLDLEVGYSREKKTWEVIIKYSGTENELESVLRTRFPNDFERFQLQGLSGNYGIIEIPAEIVDAVASLSEIEYMEKPKRLFFTVNGGKSASCMNTLQTGALLSGGPDVLSDSENSRKCSDADGKYESD